MIDIIIQLPKFNPNWAAHKDLNILRGKVERFGGYNQPINNGKDPYPKNIITGEML